ncbi:MAG: carboxymuconolactone decarboxylase family protein [Myxococcota bacterium]
MSTISSEHGTLPLEPIDRPKGLFMRLLYGALRRRYGLVPTVIRVIYARSTSLALLSALIGLRIQFFTRLERDLRFLLQVSMSMHANCTFCADLWLAEAVKARVGRERFRDLLSFETSDGFSAREKAALAYAAAVDASPRVPDEVWRRLRAHFSDRECIDIVWLCAIERYYNMMALPLRIGSDRILANVESRDEATTATP